MGHSPPGSSVHGIFQARMRNGLPFPSSKDLANPGIEPASLMSPALARGFFTTRAPWEAPNHTVYSFFRLASISNMYLSFLHVSSWIDSLFLFSVEYYSIIWMYHSLSIYLLSLSPWAAITEQHELGGLNNNFFLTVLEAEKCKIKAPRFSFLLACRWSPSGCLLVCECVLGHFSLVRLFATPWTVAHQAPLSMGFSRREYCSGLPCPPPGDLPNTGIEPRCLMFPVGKQVLLPLAPPGKPSYYS